MGLEGIGLEGIGLEGRLEHFGTPKMFLKVFYKELRSFRTLTLSVETCHTKGEK